MLSAAARAAADRRSVYVIVESMRQVDYMLDLAHKHGIARHIDNGAIKFETCNSVNFDWYTGTIIGAHPNCLVFVDHCAIEQRYANVLAELHQYDLPTPTERAR